MNQDPAQWMATKVAVDAPPFAIRISSLSAADRDMWALMCFSGDITLMSEIIHNVIDT